MPTRWLPSLFVSLVISSLATAQMPTPDKKQIAEWIKELGARQFTKRDKAQQKLWEAGEAAESALREAAKSDDAEIKRRATAVLAKFKWGIYPTTPKALIELIEAYQAAERNAKLTLVAKFFDQGNAGCTALLKALEAEESEDVRREIYAVVSREAGRAIPALMAERNFPMLETLLELTLTSDRDFTLPHYVAFYLLRDKLDERIAHFKKLARDGKDTEKTQEVLFFLCRAKGDVEGAKAAAEKARRHDLLLAYLEERGEWQALASKDFQMEERSEIERLGYRAAYQRLAGKTKEFEAAVAALKKYGEGQEADSPERWNAAKALFLNGRTDDALALIGKGWTTKYFVDIQTARMHFGAALAVVNARTGDARNDDIVDVVGAKILHFLGKKEDAKDVLVKLGKKIKPEFDPGWHEDLVDLEYRLGMREEAYEHCAKALMGNPSPLAQGRLLKKIFGGRDETAQAWWTVLRRKQASEDALVTMKSLRKLMGGEIKGKELVSLVGEMEGLLKEQQPSEKARFYQAAGEVALKIKDEDLAKTCFQKGTQQGDSAAPLIKWGDHLAGQKKWAEAAEAYQEGWEKDRRSALALYLRGWALVQAGKKKEGEGYMEQAHWLPLGDDAARLEFARALAMRERTEDSRRERALLLKTAMPGSFQVGEAQRLDAIDAFEAKDYVKSAQLHELAMLRCLRSYISFIETQAYVGVPHYIHRIRARGLVMAGKYDEAKADIAFCRTAMPGNVDLATQLVPALEKQGKKKEAEELYEAMKTFKLKLLKEYPDSPGLCNSYAWLAACCRRDLETAQTYAEKAVRLEPDLPGYRDTLAEVLFQRGKKDEAVAQIKKCLEKEPKREYYRKQLKRFEAGDPKADVPPEHD